MAKAKKKELSPEERLQEALIPVEDQPHKLPDNWRWVHLELLVNEIKNGTTIKQDKSGNGYNVTRIESLQNQTIDFNRLGTITDNTKIKDVDWYINGDVALSHINSAEHVGKTAVITGDMLPLVHGMNLLRLRFNNLYLPTLFQYYTQTFEYKEAIRNRINMAVNQVSINQKQLSSLEMPLPPLAEQQRIVECIESLFAKLDEAKEKAQQALESFESRKTALLLQAFAGNITSSWRHEHSHTLNEWETLLLKDVCVINPRKLDTKNLPDDLEVSFFPMPALSEITGEITEPQTRKLAEVRTGFTNFSTGDVVFAKITPCMENGKSAVIGPLVNDIGYGTTEFFVLRCNKKLFNRYLYHMIRNQAFRDEAKSVMTGAVGQQRVQKSFLEEYRIQLPPIDEQQEIVRLLDDFIQQEQQAKTQIESTLESIDLLKKTILAKAFRGELGTGNIEDESAELLLKKMFADET